MNGRRFPIGAVAALVLVTVVSMGSPIAREGTAPSGGVAATVISLPKPVLTGGMTLERAMAERRSIRALADAPIPVQSLSRLLWAAQGLTDDKGHRTVPSARATYPMDVIAVVGNVTGVPAGVYRFDPATHALTLRTAGDQRQAFVDAAIQQPWIPVAAVVFVITGTPERAREKMGERAGQFIGLEAGLSAQNVMLEVTSLGLGSTFVGGFDGAKAAVFLGLLPGETVHAILPVGVRK